MRVAALYDVHGMLPRSRRCSRRSSGRASTRSCSAATSRRARSRARRSRSLRALERRCTSAATATRARRRRRTRDGTPATALGRASALDGDGELELRSPAAARRSTVDGSTRVLFCHATPRATTSIDHASRRPTSASPRPRRASRSGVVVCGHTHMQFDRTVGGARWINAGPSACRTRARSRAFWAILEAGRRVPAHAVRRRARGAAIRRLRLARRARRSSTENLRRAVHAPSRRPPLRARRGRAGQRD